MAESLRLSGEGLFLFFMRLSLRKFYFCSIGKPEAYRDVRRQSRLGKRVRDLQGNRTSSPTTRSLFLHVEVLTSSSRSLCHLERVKEPVAILRSEERRVGKECRSRW